MVQNQQSFADIVGVKDEYLESTQTVDSYSFDKEIYQEIYNTSPAIQQTVQDGDDMLRTFPDLAQDLYMGLYKHRPQLVDMDDMKDTHRFNQQMMQQLMESDEFRDLRKNTRLDMVTSALGMEAMGEHAVQIIREYEEEMKAKNEGQSPFEDVNNQMDGAPEESSTPGSSQGQGAGGGPLPDPNQPNPPQPQNQPQPYPQAMQRALEKMKEAASKVADDVSETRDFLSAWGMEGGNGIRTSLEDKKHALQRLRQSKKVRELTDLVGRMKKIAINEQKDKTEDGAESIKSVVTGSDITSILPSEKAMLASSNPALKKMFYRKYFENELLQYDKDNYESKGKGPMIVCVDVSGSMGGQREHWSKAVALAFLEVAQKQKRNFACIHYSSYVDEVWEIPYGEMKPDDIFDIAEKFANGGTNFEAPLQKSVEIIERNKNFEKADVLFLTDGDCGVGDRFLDEFMAKKKKLNFSVHTVLIDMYGGGAMSTVKRFSDRIVEVSDLAERAKQDKGTIDIFRNL